MDIGHFIKTKLSILAQLTSTPKSIPFPWINSYFLGEECKPHQLFPMKFDQTLAEHSEKWITEECLFLVGWIVTGRALSELGACRKACFPCKDVIQTFLITTLNTLLAPVWGWVRLTCNILVLYWCKNNCLLDNCFRSITIVTCMVFRFFF